MGNEVGRVEANNEPARAALELSPLIEVSYKDKAAANGLRTMMFASPFWLIWAPVTIFWLGQALIAGGIFGDSALLFLWFFFVGFFTICCFTIFVCKQNKFLITRKGIRFPLRCLLELGFKLNRSWDEIACVTFRNRERNAAAPSTNPDTISVRFYRGELPLELNAFTSRDLQNFILALQSYVPELRFEPPLSEVQLPVAIETKTRQNATFTQIWEDDMQSRFGSTVFVPLEPGDKLQAGRLEVLGQIAFGGLSAIYLAKNADGQLTVIKEAVVPGNADKESAEKAMEMFAREAQILMNLKNPRIARVFDHFVENKRHYMLLEYIDGKDLRRYVAERGPQSELLVLRWAIEIGGILDYLHKLEPPVVHRDLTPDNLVLEKDGGIVLIDFGAANQFLGTATGTLVGKQAYISPEQFRGHAEPASDLYALGATISFLLTGSDPEALCTSNPANSSEDVSPEFDSLVAKLTAMEVEERFQTAEEFVLACRAILNSRKKEVV